MYQKFYTTAMCPQRRTLEKRFHSIRHGKPLPWRAVPLGLLAALVLVSAAVFASGALKGHVQGTPESGAALGGQAAGRFLNLLVCGEDQSGERADAVILFSADYQAGTLTALSIPRDTLVTAGGQEVKLSALYGAGGAKAAASAVRDEFGLPADYYAGVSLEAFRSLVDALGGVEFNVPAELRYEDPYQDLSIDLRQGPQTLDGHGAEGLFRYRRGYPEGDLGRVSVQQSFLTELLRQKLSGEELSRIQPALETLLSGLDTNYPLSRLPGDLGELARIGSGSVRTLTLPGEPDRKNGVICGYAADQSGLEALKQEYFSENAE